jgi:hypothetical protein
MNMYGTVFWVKSAYILGNFRRKYLYRHNIDPQSASFSIQTFVKTDLFDPEKRCQRFSAQR